MPAMSAGKCRRVISRNVLLMNWNGPKAVDLGCLACADPPDSADMSRSRNMSNSAAEAVSTNLSAIDVELDASMRLPIATYMTNAKAAAKLTPHTRTARNL